MISVQRSAFIARSTLPDRWQTISRWPHHLSCSCWVQKRWIRLFFSSLFFATSLISSSRHGGMGGGGGRVTKTTTWLSVALATSASRPKANWGGGVGGWTRRESFQKICTYRVSVSRSRVGKRWGFSIMDKLLIRWELGLFLWPILPPPNSPLSIHPSLPPILCHPSCLLPIQDVSHFPWLDSYIRNAQKNLASLCGQNTTFHLNYLIDFLTVYCFFPSSSSSSLHLFFFSFPGSLSPVWNTKKHAYTHIELNSISASDGHFWQNTKCIS